MSAWRQIQDALNPPAAAFRDRCDALEAEIALLRAQKLEWNQRAVRERERYERLRDASLAVVDQDRSLGDFEFEEALHRLWMLIHAVNPEIKADERTP